MTAIDVGSLIAEVDPLLRAGDSASFRAAFRALGRAGVFRPFAGAKSLWEGAELLERLGHDLDDLGVFISIISGCGLALPILELAASQGRLPEPDLFERVLSGDSVIAVAITERGARSDALGMRTALARSGDGLVLRGSKWNITNAPVADHIVVFCQDEASSQRRLSALLVPRSAPGMEIPAPQRLIGCRSSPTGEILFHDVPVDPSWILPVDGKELLDSAFLRERVLAPWPLIGKMARVIQEGIDHIQAREQFGQPLKDFQYVQDKIVSSYERLEASRLLAREAVLAAASGAPSHARASLAKHYATDSAVAVFRSILEVYGSYGLQEDARIGGYIADALCATIAGGTREIHKKVIFDQLLLDRSRARRRGVSQCFHVTARALARARNRPGGG